MKHLLICILIFSFQKSFAAVIVKDGTISVSGSSAVDLTNGIIYGGIAGAASPVTGDGVSTTNTCIDTSGGAKACNQSSVYSTLPLKISFQLTASVANAKAKLFLETTPGVFSELTGSTQTVTATASSTYVTLVTDWGTICSNSGLGSNCVGTSAFITKGLKFGVDSGTNSDVVDADRKLYTIKLHYIAPGDAVTQSFCASTPAGAGVCNVAFAPGDEKVFIDSAKYAGLDSSSGAFDWEAIAVFPIATNTGSESATYTGFTNGQAQPIFKTIDTDGNIPDSRVDGGIANFQQYCMVYGTRNKAQNIYKFVTDAAAATTGCVTPSQVIGLLDDKHCFISTAAFGSIDAPEVEIFRKFRNRFLLTNSAGELFVKTYYKLSPPLAEIISGNSYLKASTRLALYPLLIFAYTAVQLGFFVAALLTLLAFLILLKLRFVVESRAVKVMLIFLLLTPLLKAEILPEETKVENSAAREGLVRIKKDGTYVYDVKRKLRTESSTVTFGQANYPDISIDVAQVDAQGNPTGATQNFNFKDFYNETSGLIVGYDYNWFPFIDKGKLGAEAGLSAMFVSGHGKLTASPNPDSKEAFTFITLPLTLGAIYRMEWKDKQLLAPYVAGGGTYVVLLEKREDKSTPNVIGGFGFYGKAGVLLNLGVLDSDMGFQLDSEYGISNMWVSLEFKAVEVSGDAFSFSNKYVNAGLSFDF
jgi:hypothetical protein